MIGSLIEGGEMLEYTVLCFHSADATSDDEQRELNNAASKGWRVHSVQMVHGEAILTSYLLERTKPEDTEDGQLDEPNFHTMVD